MKPKFENRTELYPEPECNHKNTRVFGSLWNYCPECGKVIEKKKRIFSDYFCSICDAQLLLKLRYCPGCGIKVEWDLIGIKL